MTRIDNGILLTQAVFYYINFANFCSIAFYPSRFCTIKKFSCWLDPSKTVQSLTFCQCSEHHIIRRVDNVMKYCKYISLNCFIAYQRTVGVNGSPSLWLSFDMHGEEYFDWQTETKRGRSRMNRLDLHFFWIQTTDFDYILLIYVLDCPATKTSRFHTIKNERIYFRFVCAFQSGFSFENCVNRAACDCVYYHYVLRRLFVLRFAIRNTCDLIGIRIRAQMFHFVGECLCIECRVISTTQQHAFTVGAIPNHFANAISQSYSHHKHFPICIIHCVRTVTGNYRQRSAPKSALIFLHTNLNVKRLCAVKARYQLAGRAKSLHIPASSLSLSLRASDPCHLALCSSRLDRAIIFSILFFAPKSGIKRNERIMMAAPAHNNNTNATGKQMNWMETENANTKNVCTVVCLCVCWVASCFLMEFVVAAVQCRDGSKFEHDCRWLRVCRLNSEN